MSPFLHELLSTFPRWFGWAGEYSAFYQKTLCVIPLVPFLGFLVNGFCRKSITATLSGVVASAAAGGAFLWTLLSFLSMLQPSPASGPGPLPLHFSYGTWIEVGGFSCAFGLYLDQLSGVLALVVTGVGTLIHIYSIGYMGHDKSFARYFAYLNLFLFAMLLLTLGDNLIMMFVGWEGVGLCSYLLIGFWYEDPAKAVAGMKAFVFNRVGDLGFLLGIFTLIVCFGTVNYVAPAVDAGANHPGRPGLLELAQQLKATGKGDARIEVGYRDLQPGGLDLSGTLAPSLALFKKHTLAWAVTLACILLFVGAMGKSAQLPLYAWLPDAMAGPTPVSALIHAATMVTAGVYMVSRMHGFYLLSEKAMLLVATVGALTALFAALCGLTQTDIKKVLAYSTVSQLGYMFLGAGVGAFGLAMFHVVTHAFFKALLFLGAGSVIHGLHHEQDMRKMGGLRSLMPVTFLTMLLGALALSGFWFSAGWYSKDQILQAVLATAQHKESSIHYLLYLFGIVGATCTAFYTFRLIGLTFFGTCRAEEHTRHQIHESPSVMTIPLLILALCSVAGGWVLGDRLDLTAFIGAATPALLANEEVLHHAHYPNLGFTSLAAVAGIGLAVLLYILQGRLVKAEAGQGFLYRLSKNKFYLEAFYDHVVTALFTFFAQFVEIFVEAFFIDFLLVRGAGWLTKRIGAALRLLQTGVLNGYAAAILVGALAVLYVFLSR